MSGSLHLLALAGDEKTNVVKGILFILVIVITVFGLSKVREALLGRKTLTALALGALASAGVFICAIGVAEILLVWYDGFPNEGSIGLLVHGLLILLAVAVLERWWGTSATPATVASPAEASPPDAAR